MEQFRESHRASSARNDADIYEPIWFHCLQRALGGQNDLDLSLWGPQHDSLFISALHACHQRARRGVSSLNNCRCMAHVGGSGLDSVTARGDLQHTLVGGARQWRCRWLNIIT